MSLHSRGETGVSLRPRDGTWVTQVSARRHLIEWQRATRKALRYQETWLRGRKRGAGLGQGWCPLCPPCRHASRLFVPTVPFIVAFLLNLFLILSSDHDRIANGGPGSMHRPLPPTCLTSGTCYMMLCLWPPSLLFAACMMRRLSSFCTDACSGNGQAMQATSSNPHQDPSLTWSPPHFPSAMVMQCFGATQLRVGSERNASGAAAY